MKQYPLVESLGVLIDHHDAHGAYVQVENLEAALQKLPKVYGIPGQIFGAEKNNIADTHEARLLGVTEIKKEPLKLEKTIHFPEGHRAFSISGEEFGSKLAGKKCKVTFEEIP